MGRNERSVHTRYTRPKTAFNFVIEGQGLAPHLQELYYLITAVLICESHHILEHGEGIGHTSLHVNDRWFNSYRWVVSVSGDYVYAILRIINFFIPDNRPGNSIGQQSM